MGDVVFRLVGMPVARVAPGSLVSGTAAGPVGRAVRSRSDIGAGGPGPAAAVTGVTQREVTIVVHRGGRDVFGEVAHIATHLGPGGDPGRAFAVLRTLMQATPPLGSALVTPLLVHSQLATASIAMTLVAGLPALYLIFAVDDGSSTPTADHAPKPTAHDAEERH